MHRVFSDLFHLFLPDEKLYFYFSQFFLWLLSTFLSTQVSSHKLHLLELSSLFNDENRVAKRQSNPKNLRIVDFPNTCRFSHSHAAFVYMFLTVVVITFVFAFIGDNPWPKVAKFSGFQRFSKTAAGSHKLHFDFCSYFYALLLVLNFCLYLLVKILLLEVANEFSDIFNNVCWFSQTASQQAFLTWGWLAVLKMIKLATLFPPEKQKCTILDIFKKKKTDF